MDISTYASYAGIMNIFLQAIGIEQKSIYTDRLLTVIGKLHTLPLAPLKALYGSIMRQVRCHALINQVADCWLTLPS